MSLDEGVLDHIVRLDRGAQSHRYHPQSCGLVPSNKLSIGSDLTVARRVDQLPV